MLGDCLVCLDPGWVPRPFPPPRRGGGGGVGDWGLGPCWPLAGGVTSAPLGLGFTICQMWAVVYLLHRTVVRKTLQALGLLAISVITIMITRPADLFPWRLG